MLTMRQIEVFRAVMRSRTLVGAAELLHVTQPTVTKTLMRVEDVLGVALFERSPGRIAPTAEAHRILAEIDRAFEDLEEAIGRALNLARDNSGTFRVGASPSVGRVVIPRVLASMVRAHPALSVHFEALSVVQILDYVLAAGSDCAVGLFPITHARVRSLMVGSGRLVALVPSTHPLGALGELTPLDLRDATLIVFEPHTVHGQAIAQFLGECEPVRTHLVRFAESAIGLAEAGLGIALVDEFSALSVDAASVQLRPTSYAGRFDVYLHVPRDRPQSRFVAQFKTELQRALDRPDWAEAAPPGADPAARL